MSFFKKKDKKGAAPGSVAGTPEKQKTAAPISTAQQVPAVNTTSANASINSLPPTDQPRSRQSEDPQGYGPRPGTSSGPVAPTTPANSSILYPWSQRQLVLTAANSSPFPRYGAAVNAVASKEGEIYIMGGLVNGQTVKGDLWMVESGAGLECHPVRTEADGPGPRVGHASLLVGNAFIVFGGDTKQDENDPLDDTLYLLNTSTKQWSRAVPPGPRPAGRYGHTLNIMGSKLYVFGGQVDGHFFNDLLAFDLNQLQNPTNHWELLVVDSAHDQFDKVVPLGRTNHTMISWQDKLFLFGGTDGVQWFNDVWTYDPRTNAWSQLDCIGYIPQPREGHSAALVDDLMYIFGGRTQEGDDLGDLAAFRISSRRWYTFQNMGPAPSPRSGHSMTAFDKQIVVLAGEPSSVQRDPAELGLVYLLDTAKIRYKNDQQIQQTPAGERVAGNRRPSTDNKINGRPMMNRDASPQTSNLPRQSTIPASQAASGPPPLQQAPAPGPALSTAARQNVNITNISNMIPPGSRSRTPTEGRRIHTGSDHSRGLSYDDRPELNDATRNAGMRSISAASNNRSALPQQVQYGNIHTEDESSGPANGLGKSLSQIRTSRQGQYTNNGDDSTDTLAAQNGTFLARDTMVFDDADAPHMKSGKEIDDLKKSNASLLAELAAARKAGYITGAYQDSSLDGNTSSIGEQHQRIPEQISRIRNAFSDGSNDIPKKMQKLVQHIAELERQRDAAVKDAANANARLSASADSPSGSPSLGSREIDHHHDHSNAVSRKLATTIAAHKALQSKLSAVEADHASEKQARELAESNVEAAHRRALHFDEVHDPGELETLRSDLHQAQTEARANAILLNELQSHSQIVDIEHEDLKRQHSEHVSSSTDHVAFIGSLRSAVSASEEKFTLLERKLIEEREAKESLQSKLAQLRTEHEDRTAELDSTSKKLRDSEELAEKHANEATKHRQVLLAGLDRLGTRPTENAAAGTHEKKLVVLQQQIKDSNALVVKSKTDAERASDKLRSAEERIAGLEAYQLQSSREALTLRKQLQDAIRTAQQYQSQHTEVRSKLEANQRAVSVLGIQHGALRNIMEQRSDSATRSLESPGPGLGIDNLRLQELEQLLNDSYRAHEETKSSFESSQQVSEKAYREKLEQLEQDYQSAVSYVKGTEKMLKRMKDELTKSKSQNVRLQSELEASRSGSTIPAPVGWESEREAMQQEIDKMQGSVKAAIAQLETQVADVQKELHTVQNERDQFRVRNDQLNMAVEQTHVELQTHKRDNAALEVRATDAESKITLLLDQMEHSVDHYRRQSQMQQTQPNGVADHTRDISVSTYGGGHSHSNSIGGESFSTSGLDRNSMALDNLASELETLRTQWEGTHKTYRLSNNFDFDRRPSETNGGGGGNVGAGSGGGGGGELSSSLASWRKRLEAEERDKDRISDPTPAALRTGPSRQES